MPVTKYCAVCQQPFSCKPSAYDKRTYCSMACMSKAYNKRLEKNCLVCGKTFHVPNNQFRRDAKFCSNACRGKDHSGENHWNYQHGRGQNYTQEQRKKWCDTYYRKNREAINERLRREKLRRRETEAGHTWEQWIDLLKRYDNQCHYCGKRMTKKMGPNQRTRDHVVALINGGTDDINNIVPACRSCNSKKGAKPVDEVFQ